MSGWMGTATLWKRCVSICREVGSFLWLSWIFTAFICPVLCGSEPLHWVMLLLQYSRALFALSSWCHYTGSVHWLLRVFATTHISIFMECRKPQCLPVGAGFKLHHVFSLYKLFFCRELVNLPILRGFPVMIKYLYKYFMLSFRC